MVQLYFSLLLVLIFCNGSVAQDEVAEGTPIRITRPKKDTESSGSSIRIVKVEKPQQSLRYPNPGLATTGATSVELAGSTYPLTYIDGCNRDHNIGFKFFLESRMTCDFSAKIHPHAVRFLNNNLHDCTAEALKTIGITKPVARVDIYSQGVQRKRKVSGSSRWSNHSLGAAIDMSDVEIEFEDGSKDVFPVSAINPRNGKLNDGFKRCRLCPKARYTRTGRAKFYDGFYTCMKAKVAAFRAEKKKEGISCTGGVLGCDYNSDHANHIHLSVPICPAPRGVATI